MSIEDLINKLKTENGGNGAWNLLLCMNNRLKDLRGRLEKEESAIDRVLLKNDIYNECREMSGFIWGLFAADYISEAECDALRDELNKSTRRFYYAYR